MVDSVDCGDSGRMLFLVLHPTEKPTQIAFYLLDHRATNATSPRANLVEELPLVGADRTPHTPAPRRMNGQPPARVYSRRWNDPIRSVSTQRVTLAGISATGVSASTNRYPILGS